jgi:predicted nucleic acid-binding protein
MNVIDSSAWIEFFQDGPNAAAFQGVITDTTHVLVPSITLYEVFKYILLNGTEQQAIEAIAAMRRGRIVDLDASLALDAATLSRRLRLPMADSIVLATAVRHGATVWTQDADFANLENVRFFRKVE